MISKQTKKFEPCAEITDKELYEHGEEMALRRKWTQDENIDGLDLHALDYVMFLDRQVYCQIRKDIDMLTKRVDDIAMHYKEVRDYRDGLLGEMECHEASKHFEDYMNVPFPDVYDSRVPDSKNHFANMYGIMINEDYE